MKFVTLFVLMMAFCCLVDTTITREQCSDKCQTAFDLCIHSSPTIMDLLLFIKKCSNERKYCKTECHIRKKREILMFVPVKIEKDTKRNERKCFKECQQQQLKNCDQKTFNAMYLCLRVKCRQKCSVKVRLRMSLRKTKMEESTSLDYLI